MKLFLTFAAAILVFSSCAPAAQSEISRTDFVLGTVCTIRLIEGGSTKTTDEIFQRLRQIEDRMSANKDGTEIAAVNASAGGKPVKVSEDTFFVISQAVEYAGLAGGAFDPTVGPLVKLWNIGNEGAHVPQKSEIASALKLIDYRKVELDPKNLTVRLAMPGMKLDLGAIAKGYSADEVARILDKYKVKSAIVDLGGNVLVYGRKKDGTAWRVGVQDPLSDRGEFIGLVTGYAETVVTSGIYERFFIQDGKRYHHILDTKTGFPLDNGLVSVSIITESSIRADALSTTVFALGLENGMKLVKSLPDVHAVFIDDKNRVYLSPGTNKLFTLTNPAYTLSE
ncbi:MAG TPA: FAD:protein FMN transferase [Rectinemataceae bacterium]|nr:FAD:protein FMN transferase [Rectinemataceae bacterium]